MLVQPILWFILNKIGQFDAIIDVIPYYVFLVTGAYI